MKKIYIAVGIVAVLLVLIGLGIRGGNKADERLALEKIEKEKIVAASPTVLELQANGEGSITVDVTPRIGDDWRFDIALNTHSGDLSEDFMRVATLIDDAGNTHAPIAWEGDPAGGHHRAGVLIFAAPAPRPASFTLTVNVGAIERSFRWAF
jgi:hypothetical protein